MLYLLVSDNGECMAVSKYLYDLCKPIIYANVHYRYNVNVKLLVEEERAFISQSNYDRIKLEGFDWINKK